MKTKLIIVICILLLPLLLFACGPEEAVKKQIAVKYMIDEETMYRSVVITLGSQITLPEDPERTGYTFEGWYLNPEDAATIFTKDYFANMTQAQTPFYVYAKWTESDPQTILYTFTVSSENEAGGSVTASGELFAENESVTVTAAANEGYRFDGWYQGGRKMSNETVYTFSMPRNDYALTARFTAIIYQLSTQSEDTGKGTVQGDNGNKTIGNNISVFAVPKEGHSFEGWYRNGEKVSANALYTFTMPAANVELTARFIINLYICSILSENNDYGTVSPHRVNAIATYHTVINVTAYPNTGYSFTGWYLNGELLSQNAEHSFTFPAYDCHLRARFVKNSYSLTVSSDIPDAGALTGGQPSVLFTDTATVTATPPEGYSFDGWYEGENKVSDGAEYAFQMPAHNVTLIARFIANVYQINIVNVTNEGTASAVSSLVEYKAAAILIADPNEGYSFLGWYEEDTLLSEELQYSFDMPHRNMDIEPRFDAITYHIKYHLNGGAFQEGFAAPATYTVEDSIALPVAANVMKTGYSFLSWALPSAPDTAVTAIAAGSIGDKNFYAGWSVNSYPLAAQSEDISKGSVSGTTGNVVFDTETVLTATAATGYSFSGWYENDVLVFAEASYTFNMPARGVTLVAKFQPKLYTLTVKSSNTGYGTVTSPGKDILFGSAVTLRATPKTGYYFTGWFSGAENVSADAEYSFLMPAYDVTLTANFANVIYSLTLLTEDDAKGTVSVNKTSFNYGEMTTVTATKRGNYVLEGWYDGTTRVSFEAVYTFPYPAKNLTLTAKWIESPCTITYDLGGGGYREGYAPPAFYNSQSGIVPLPSPSDVVKAGYTLQYFYLTSDPLKAPVYSVDSGAGTVSDKHFTAVWSINIYTLTLSSEGGGDIPLGAGQYNHGQTVTLVSSAHTGYGLSGWYENGVLVSDTATYVFEITGDRHITAVYSLNVWELTVQNSYVIGGNISDESGSYLYGDAVTLTASPNEGYLFLGWFADNALVTLNIPYIFNMPDHSLVIEARWAAEIYTVHYELDGGSFKAGYVPTSQFTVESDAFTLPAAVNLDKTGYRFIKWILDGDNTETEVTAIPAGSIGNVTVVAVWQAKEYKLTVRAGANGTFTSENGYQNLNLGINVSFGTSVTVTAVPDYGYSFLQWREADIIADAGAQYTFTMPDRDYSIIVDFVSSPRTEGLAYSLNEDGQSYTVTGKGTSISTNIMIPEIYSASDPRPVTGIAANAFLGTNIITVTVPKSVVTIGERAFSQCLNLVAINLSTENTHFLSVDGALYTADGKTLLAYPSKNALSSIVIPQGTERIAAGAFYASNYLKYIYVPSSVAAMGEGAIQNCPAAAVYCEAASPDWVALWTDSTAVYYGVSSLNETDGAHYILQEGIYTLSKYVGAASSFTALSNLGGTPVARIGSGAFSNCATLSTINLPAQLETVGDYAFDGAKNIVALAIPQTVKHIGAYAFRGMRVITNLVIPSLVESLGIGVFSGMSSLQTLTLPFVGTSKATYNIHKTLGILFGETNYGGSAEVTGHYGHKYYIPTSLIAVNVTGESTVAEGAFKGMAKIKYITYEETVTSIGDYAFDGCSALTAWDFKEGLLSIGMCAFRYCNSLTSISLPSSLLTLGSYVFNWMTSLQAVSFASPSSLTTIPDYAFERCQSLLSITLPSSVTGIGAGAFNSCDALTSASFLSDSSLTIGQYAFERNYELREINVPYAVTTLGKYAFFNCFSLVKVTFASSLAVPEHAFENCQSLTEFDILNNGSILSAGDYAFRYCFSLTKIFVSDAGSITDLSFTDCPSLILYFYGSTPCETAEYNSDTRTTVNNVRELYSDGNFDYALHTGSASVMRYNGSDSNVAVPQTVKSLPVNAVYGKAFYRNTLIETVYLHDGVLSIKDAAFEGCSSLTIYCSVNEKPSEWSSLWNVSSRPVVYNVAELGTSGVYQYIAFHDSSLEIVKYNGTADIISVPSALGSYNVTSIGKGAFSGAVALTSLTIPESVTTIGAEAFSNCTSLSSLTLSEGLLDIGEYAFINCANLTTVILPASLSSIGIHAFSGSQTVFYCRAAAKPAGYEANWKPDANKTVWDYASQVTTDLYVYTLTNAGTVTLEGYLGIDTEFIVPDEIDTYPVTKIADYAFASSLFTSVTVGTGIQAIGRSAFDYSYYLSSVTFAENSVLEEIGAYAFRQCRLITELIIPASVTTLGSGMLSGTTSLHTLAVPFTGAAKDASGESAVFGYLFGNLNYTGAVATYQEWASNQASTFYIPSSLRSVEILSMSDEEGNAIPYELPYGAFSGCSVLTRVTLASSVNIIDTKAFYGCSFLKEIVIDKNSSLVTISDYAFADCPSLETLYIPYGVNLVGRNIIQNDSRLSIYLASGFAGEWHTQWNNAERPVVTNVSAYGDINGYKWAFVRNYPAEGEEETEVSGDIWLTGYSGTSTALQLPSQVEVIIDVPEEVENPENPEEMITVITPTPMMFDAKYIAASAFFNKTAIESVVIPSSVETIGNKAFYGCSSLNSVTFTKGGAGFSIGEKAFGGCVSLGTIHLPDNVLSMASTVFHDAGKLAITSELSSAPAGWNYNWNERNDPVLYNVKETGRYDHFFFAVTFDDKLIITNYTGSHQNLTVPAEVEYKGVSVAVYGIGSKAFAGNTKAVTLTIENGIQSIADYAFQNMSNLTSVAVPESVTVIGSGDGNFFGAFSGCGKIVNMTLPFVGQSAAATNEYSLFGYIFGIYSYTNGDTRAQKYAESAGKNYVIPLSLRSITITSASTIGYGAFSDLYFVTSVSLPGTVASMGSQAFYNCPSTLVIRLPFSSIPSEWPDDWNPNSCPVILSGM